MSDSQEFHILSVPPPSPRHPLTPLSRSPHPAKDNTAPTETTPGLGSAPNLSHLQQANPFTAKGPHQVAPEVAKGLEEPKTREELQKLQEELNK